MNLHDGGLHLSEIVKSKCEKHPNVGGAACDDAKPIWITPFLFTLRRAEQTKSVPLICDQACCGLML